MTDYWKNLRKYSDDPKQKWGTPPQQVQPPVYQPVEPPKPSGGQVFGGIMALGCGLIGMGFVALIILSFIVGMFR